MKFEEALPLMRKGLKLKCGDQSGYYIVCKKMLFDIDLGIGINHISKDRSSNDIFKWGIDGYSLLSAEWEIVEEEKEYITYKVDSVLGKITEQTIFNFFMSITKPFTPENALLTPLSTPLAEKIVNMLKQFFDEKKLGD